jgi:hypothetical protein
VKGFAKNWAFMVGLMTVVGLIFTGDAYLHRHQPWYVAQPVFIVFAGLLYALGMWWIRRGRGRG